MATQQGNQNQTGKQLGQNVTISVGEFGDQLVTELQPRYYENTYRGNVFNVANSIAIAAPTALTASSVNLTLYNPLGSGKNLVLLFVDVAVQQISEATAGEYLILLVANAVAGQAAPATVTALTPLSGLIGSGSLPVAKVYSTATLAAVPVTVKPLMSVTSATALGANTNLSSTDISGAIIVSPGSYISIQGISTTETTSPSLLCGMTWAEISQ